jgi:hypothetical protein
MEPNQSHHQKRFQRHNPAHSPHKPPHAQHQFPQCPNPSHTFYIKKILLSPFPFTQKVKHPLSAIFIKNIIFDKRIKDLAIENQAPPFPQGMLNADLNLFSAGLFAIII